MELKGKQKAAMLLMSLDAVSAAELLRGADTEVIRELAEELEYLDVTGFRQSKQNSEIALQFCDSLDAKERFQLKGFFNTVLKNTVGKEKAEELETQIQNLLQRNDPIASISLGLDLRNLDKDLRNGLLSAIREKDRKVADMISDTMILWCNIGQVSDESLQKGLKGINVKKLALAMVGSERQVAQKIKSNISQRTAGRVARKAALISNATIDDIEEARKYIVKILRDMNIKGELTFTEDCGVKYDGDQFFQEEIMETDSVKDGTIGINR